MPREEGDVNKEEEKESRGREEEEQMAGWYVGKEV